MLRLGFVVLSCIVYLSPVQGQTLDEKKATIVYLRALQTPGGGFLPTMPQAKGAAAPPSLCATSSALRALKYMGGEPRDMEAARKFVSACFDKDKGAFADQPRGEPDLFTTAVGLMAVGEVKLPAEEFSKPATKYLVANSRNFEDIRIAAAGLESIGEKGPKAAAWIEHINKLRNAEGSFGVADGIARATGGSVAALLRLGAKLDNVERLVQAMQNGQRTDGGFGKSGVPGSDLESSYRIVRALVMLKQKPKEVERFRAFVAKCRNADGGYGVAPGTPSSVGGTYFAAILLNWLAEK